MGAIFVSFDDVELKPGVDIRATYRARVEYADPDNWDWHNLDVSTAHGWQPVWKTDPIYHALACHVASDAAGKAIEAAIIADMDREGTAPAAWYAEHMQGARELGVEARA